MARSFQIVAGSLALNNVFAQARAFGAIAKAPAPALASGSAFAETAAMTFAQPSGSSSPSPLGRVVMVQGTSSHAGKTTLVAALCRIFALAGYRVVPFKAQNMSNNAAVTDGGGEVGRAQAMQALAAGVPVAVDMNPVLLKPQSDRTSQVVVLGRARCTTDAREYFELRSELWPVVTGALDRLRAANDIVVIEGAGSPAEINLAQYDIVNMRVALHANAPVLLVGDIERGGVFAALYGTVALLTEKERALVRAFVINKFRGDESLLDSGLAMLRERTGIPTIGVLPHLDLSHLPAEDSLDWELLRRRHADGCAIDIAVMRLPRVANLDEFQPLACEPGVRVRFIGAASELGAPDLIIIPGTKSTLADLQWLWDRGLAQAVRSARARGTPILGICGGFQMLGRGISDDDGVEGTGSVPALELLPITTTFVSDKVTRRVSANVANENALWGPGDLLDDGMSDSSGGGTLAEAPLAAYEIHMGRTRELPGSGCARPFAVRLAKGEGETDRVADEGLVSPDGLVIGTYMHGLLENAPLRRAMLRRLASSKGVELPATGSVASVDSALNTLAATVRERLDMSAVATLVGIDKLR